MATAIPSGSNSPTFGNLQIITTNADLSISRNNQINATGDGNTNPNNPNTNPTITYKSFYDEITKPASSSLLPFPILTLTNSSCYGITFKGNISQLSPSPSIAAIPSTFIQTISYHKEFNGDTINYTNYPTLQNTEWLGGYSSGLVTNSTIATSATNATSPVIKLLFPFTPDPSGATRVYTIQGIITIFQTPFRFPS